MSEDTKSDGGGAMRRARRRALVASLALLAAWLAGSPAVADVEHPEPLSAFPQSLLAIRTTRGTVLDFQIWTADTPGRDAQGLMYVKHMDLHAGMLFLFPKVQRVSMWMKNTYLPLDMLFIGSTGRIDYIAANATPLSLDVISAPDPERAVLELNGGAAETLGIHVGDRVLHSSFPASK